MCIHIHTNVCNGLSFMPVSGAQNMVWDSLERYRVFLRALPIILGSLRFRRVDSNLHLCTGFLLSLDATCLSGMYRIAVRELFRTLCPHRNTGSNSGQF